MKAAAILQELEGVAEKLDIKVSYEALGVSVGLGGLCRVKGQYRVIIDKRASPQDRAVTLAQALVNFDAARFDPATGSGSGRGDPSVAGISRATRRFVAQYLPRPAVAREAQGG